MSRPLTITSVTGRFFRRFSVPCAVVATGLRLFFLPDFSARPSSLKQHIQSSCQCFPDRLITTPYDLVTQATIVTTNLGPFSSLFRGVLLQISENFGGEIATFSTQKRHRIKRDPNF